MIPFIESNDLVKGYGSIRALDHLTLSLGRGKSIGLVGPNGAGKTTFLSLLCGFIRPTSGNLRVMGHTAGSRALKGRIGTLPQDVPFMQGIPVFAQLTLFARLQGFAGKDARRESERVLQLLDCRELGRQFPETLSFGQRKKVTLAQALVGQPDLVLLDEPTSGLDPVAVNGVRAIIRKLRDGHSFIISSHNLEEIKDICEEIVVINKGKLVRHCAIDDLLEKNSYLTVLLDRPVEPSLLQTFEQMPAIIKVSPDRDKPNRLSIYFKSDNPDELQYEILDFLRKSGVVVNEFSRGTAFTDKVVELVS